jgi:Rrf2 family protein
MALVTKDTDYAMRALVYMSGKREELVSVKEISGHLDIPHSYLRKLLQRLGTAGVLASTKGKNGGFSLRKNPGDITIQSLVKLFQDDIGITHCMVRSKECPNIKTCIVHRKLVALESDFEKQIGIISIKTILESGKRKNTGRSRA